MLTNEEYKVPVYYANNDFTVPGQVSGNTPLESLNLNWREKDLPEKVRTRHVHKLHPYLGKYIPQLVEIFLRKYFKKGDVVLDPFCGSGTTLVQANELGINSIGYDVSAFNVLLSGAKTKKYNISLLEKELFDILEKVQNSTQMESSQLTLDGNKFSENNYFRTDDSYMNDWFAPKALNELLSYLHFIETGNYQYADLMKIILSRSARSARLTTHFDLDFPKKPQREPYWCYKHSRTCCPTEVAFKFIRRYTLDTLKRIKEFDEIRTDASVEVFHADSGRSQFPPINGVITSPPYVGLIDYHEQHSYAYRLLGLKDLREFEIGAAANGVSKKAKQKYQNEIAAVFKNALSAMPSGGVMVVIANDRQDLYSDIGEMIGVEGEGIVNRHVNRRTGRRSGEYYESVFIWRKP